jgi:WD40 repeat protein
MLATTATFGGVAQVVAGPIEAQKPQPQQSLKPAIYPQLGHSSNISQAIFSSNGRYVVTISSLGESVNVWDVHSRKLFRSLPSPSRGYRIAISPDNQVVAVSGVSNVRLWDINTGQVIRDLEKIPRLVTDLQFTTDSSQILISGQDYDGAPLLALHDFRTGKTTDFIAPPDEGSLVLESIVYSIALSRDNKWAVASHYGRVGMWELKSGKRINEYIDLVEEEWTDVKVCGAGQWILIGQELETGPKTSVWNSSTMAKVGDHDHVRLGQCYGNADQFVGIRVESNNTKRVVLFDIQTGKELRNFFRLDEQDSLADISSDGLLAIKIKNRSFLEGKITGGNDLATLWDIPKGQDLETFGGNVEAVNSVAVSPLGHLVSSSTNSSYGIWDLTKGKRVRAAKNAQDHITCVAFSSDDRLMMVASSSDKNQHSFSQTTLIDTRSGRMVWESPTQGRSDACAIGEKIATVISRPGTGENVFLSFDLQTGKQIGHLKTGLGAILSSNGQWSAYVEDGLIKVSKLGTNETFNARVWPSGVDDVGRFIFGMVFTPDNRRILLLYTDVISKDLTGVKTHNSSMLKIVLWDFRHDERIPLTLRDFLRIQDKDGLRGFDFDGSFPVKLAVSLDGSKLLSTRGSEVLSWNLQLGREDRVFRGHAGVVTGLAFLSDGRRIVTGSKDGTVRIWNAETGAELVAIAEGVTGEWVVVTPEGYYASSPDGDTHLNVRLGDQVYGIDQFRSTFYRPQVVEETLRLGDRERALVQVFGGQRPETRVGYVGFVSPPVVTIAAPADQAILSSTQMDLAIHVADATYPLRSVRVSMNGAQVWPSQARDLVVTSKSVGGTGSAAPLVLPAGARDWTATIPLELEGALNVIEVRAFNGYSESVKSITVSLPPSALPLRDTILPNLWMLSIGINAYQERQIRGLSYAEADAQAIVHAFTRQKGKLFREVHSLVISDHSALKPTYDTILDNLTYLGQAGQNDVVVLFLAGHGLNDERGDFYFLPTDAVVNPDGSLKRSKAISWRELKTILDLPAKKLILADTCHSEGVSKKKTRGVDNDRFVKELQEMNAVVFTSSRGAELSQESDEWGHGAFTYALLNGLNGKADLVPDGKVSMKELDTYVSETVPQLTNGAQHPITDTPQGYSNFPVALVR